MWSAIQWLAGMSLVLIMAGCSGTHAAGGDGPLDFEELARGSFSEVKDEQMLVIRDRDRFRSVWRQTGRSGDPPEVDFDSEMVVAAFVGERRTGGYSIRLREAEALGDEIHLRLRIEEPGRGCMVTQAHTQPWQIVKLPRVEGSAKFDVYRDTVDCD